MTIITSAKRVDNNNEDFCAQCHNHISISTRIKCLKCNNIFHKKCIKTKSIRNKLYCKSCITLHDIEIYNPPNITDIINKQSSETENSDSCEDDIAQSPHLLIGDTKISMVNEVKFLGVTFDRKLSWNAHTDGVYKRLKCAIAIIKRIKPYIANENLKTIYFTLFESHLLYGVSVWGGIPQYKLDKIFRLQKKCLRILFGNLEQFLDKFNTCARARPFGAQILSSQFYMREHTKPIFNANKILTVNNLYRYTSACELMKILKFGYPQTLANSFTLSLRNDRNLIILPMLKNSQFHYKASVIWNDLIKPLKIPSVHEINIYIFKRKLKQYLLDHQEAGDHSIWETFNN